MLNYIKKTKYPRKQELTDLRRIECFIGSLACIQPIHPLPVLRQDPEGGLAPCHEKYMGEVLLAFLSRPGMLVGRAAVKMSSLISAAEIDTRNKVEESSQWSWAWKPDLERWLINHWVPGMKTRQSLRYYLVITITKDFWLGKQVCLKLPRWSQNLPLISRPSMESKPNISEGKPYFNT